MKKILLLCMAFLSIATAVNAKPVKVIVETDLGNDIDDAVALSVLYSYQKMGKIEILAIMCNKDRTESLEFIDIMNNYYGCPDIPIGKTAFATRFNSKKDYVKSVVGQKDYVRTYGNYDDLPDSRQLYNEILSVQPDNSVHVISLGFLSNIAAVLQEKESYDGRELYDAKVSDTFVMGGSFDGEGRAEFNIRFAKEAAARFFDECPTPVYVVSWEFGNAITFPAKAISAILARDSRNPLGVSYCAFDKMPYNRQCWDPITIVAGVELNKKYFTVSAPGTINVDKDARTCFSPVSGGKHYILSANPKQTRKLSDRMVSLTK